MANKVVALDGGLVDIGSVANTESSNLKDCLNYERGIEHGYTRCDGFSRWDGQTNLVNTLRVISVSTLGYVTPITGWTLNATVVITWQDSLGTTYTVNALVINNPQEINIGTGAVTESAWLLPLGNTVDLVQTSQITAVSGASEPITASRTEFLTESTHIALAEAAYQDLVTALPMSTVGKIAGAHFFRNRLYVVADYAAFTVTGLNTLNLKEGAALRKVTGSSTIGTLVGYRDVVGDPASVAGATATFIIRAYTGVIPSNGNAIEIQTGASTYVTVANFGAFSQSPRAGLYYADYNGAGGWSAVDAGRRMRYNMDSSCSTTGFTAYQRPASGTTVAAIASLDVTVAPSSIGGYSRWYDVVDGYPNPPLASSLSTAADGESAAVSFSGTTSVPLSSGLLVVKFGDTVAASLPTGALVVGIEVTVSCVNNSTVGTITDETITLTGLTGFVANLPKSTSWDRNTVPTYADRVYGGATNNWGNALNTDELRATDFGFVMSCKRGAGSDICSGQVDKIAMKIYYRERTDKVYVVKFTSPSTYDDIDDFRVVHHTIDRGTFAAKTAEGTIVVSGLDTVYARTNEILVGTNYQLRTAAGSGGSLIGYVASLDEPCTLPSSDILADAETRWTFTTCDPWAVDDSDIMVGCSGVEEAYGFDGDYLLPIGTGLSLEAEVPRHACYFQNQLFLGYAVGIVQASDVGSVLSFIGGSLGSAGVAGQSGAAELGLSDRVTGLLPMRGQALAVFTERTIRAIYSDGAGTFDIKLISATSGAIEYTVVDMGVPVFADFRGFATLSAVQEYGDFQRGRLTNKATRLMLSCLQFETRNQTIDKRPVAMLAIRNKNQARLYRKDGYAITLTMAGDEMDPNITKQRLFISGSNTDANAVRVLALCAGVTTEGRDVAFMTVDNQSAMYPYVYQIDAGRSFDTGAIVAYIELQPEFVGSLSTLKRFDRVNVFGKAYGSASLTMKVGSTYTAPSGSRAFVLGATANTPGTDPDPYVAIVDAPIDAYGLSLRFDSSTSTELPHTLQVLDIHYKETNQAKR